MYLDKSLANSMEIVAGDLVRWNLQVARISDIKSRLLLVIPQDVAVASAEDEETDYEHCLEKLCSLNNTNTS